MTAYSIAPPRIHVSAYIDRPIRCRHLALCFSPLAVIIVYGAISEILPRFPAYQTLFYIERSHIATRLQTHHFHIIIDKYELRLTLHQFKPCGEVRREVYCSFPHPGVSSSGVQCSTISPIYWWFDGETAAGAIE